MNKSGTKKQNNGLERKLLALFESLIVVVRAFSLSRNRFLASIRIFEILSSKTAVDEFVGTLTLQ
ncbi:hypothetical protein NQ318_011269 [Aromia moschata]|uniref:Uncharacterized protein n=1 Tax=Aromia moschata TaxID=1265417 RepID=A0AAV8YIN0_9CUCU|nr:hypothetical protein NQ318_011269 [Aromia moschata]